MFRPALLTKAKMLWDQFLAHPAVPHDGGKPVRQAAWAIGPCGRQVNDGVDGAPNGFSVPRWSLSKPHLKGSRPWASLS
jgi:hypothetical protein